MTSDGAAASTPPADLRRGSRRRPFYQPSETLHLNRRMGHGVQYAFLRDALRKVSPQKEAAIRRGNMRKILSRRSDLVEIPAAMEGDGAVSSSPSPEMSSSPLQERQQQRSLARARMHVLNNKRMRINRIRTRPTVSLPRKHWLFIANGPPLQLEDLSAQSPSIFEEDTGKLEEKIEELKRRRGLKADPFDETKPFWQRRSLERNVKWELPEPSDAPEGSEGAGGKEEGAAELSDVRLISPERSVLIAGRDGSSSALRVPVFHRQETASLPLKGDRAGRTDLRTSTEEEEGEEAHTDSMGHLPDSSFPSLPGGAPSFPSMPSPEASTSASSRRTMTHAGRYRDEGEHRAGRRVVGRARSLLRLESRLKAKDKATEEALQPGACIQALMQGDSADGGREEEKDPRTGEGQEEKGEEDQHDWQRQSQSEQTTRKRQTQDVHMFDSGTNLIRTLKEKALAFEQTGVNPDLMDNIADALRYYPGIERQQRRAEMQQFEKSVEEVIQEGLGSTENFNQMIKARGLQGRFDDALQIFDKMRDLGFQANGDSYVALMQAAAVKKDASAARLLFLRMRSEMLEATPKVYGALIKAHVAEGDLNAAFSLLRKMEDEGLQGDVIIYTTLIDGCVKRNKLKKAWQTFHDARTWKNIEPDEVLFTVMIKAAAKRAEAEKALNMYDDMRASGKAPTDVTYTELIHACARRPDYLRRAFDFYNQMIAEDMPLTEQVFNHLLSACGVAGNVKKAKEVVKEMGRRQIPLSSPMYVSLISVFASAMRLPGVNDHERLCNIRYAWHVMRDAQQKGVPLKAKHLNAVMRVYIQGGFSQYAVDMLREYHRFGIDPDGGAYHQLLVMLGEDLKDPGRFFALWEYMRMNTKVKPSIPLMQLALKTAISSRSASLTVRTLREMYEAKVMPSPELVDTLARVGRRISEIHRLVAAFVQLEKTETFLKAKKETALVQAKLDEHELRLSAEGKTSKSWSEEEKIREKHFDNKRKIFGKPRLPRGEYRDLQKKGGEPWAKKVDRPKPMLLQP